MAKIAQGIVFFHTFANVSLKRRFVTLVILSPIPLTF